MEKNEKKSKYDDPIIRLRERDREREPKEKLVFQHDPE